MRNIKFELNTKVWIKSLNVEGIVVSWSISNNNPIKYTVIYKNDVLGWESNFVVAEWLGPKTCEIDVLEEDLLPVSMESDWAAIKSYMGINEQVYILNSSPNIKLENKLRPEDVLIGPKSCQHSYKRYEGFTSSYEYCEKCDHKRNP